MNRHTFLWVAAALLGIAATATVAWSASRLAATRIGLAGDPVSVTAGLAPASTSAPTRAKTPAPAKWSVKPARPARRTVHAGTTSSPPSSPTSLPATPSAPVTHTPFVTPPVTTAPPATTPAASAPMAHKSAQRRDDSGGDGAGNARQGRDD